MPVLFNFAVIYRAPVRVVLGETGLVCVSCKLCTWEGPGLNKAHVMQLTKFSLAGARVQVWIACCVLQYFLQFYRAFCFVFSPIDLEADGICAD